jgi:lysophospholipase L1-like esterase/uncharacterized protein YceK
MKIRKVLFFLILFFLVMVGCASATTHISTPTVSNYYLSVAGNTYILDNDVTAGATAFIFTGSNVTFDGQGHTITCGQTGSGNAFTSAAANNITIKDVKIVNQNTSSGARGIQIQNGNGVNLSNVNVSIPSGSAIGTLLLTCTNANVSKCQASTDSGRAIYLGTTNSTISDCVGISNSGYGGYFADASNGTTILNSVFRSTSSNGFNAGTSTRLNYSNCTFSSTSGDGIFISTMSNSTFSDCSGSTLANSGNSGFNAVSITNSNFTRCNGSLIAGSTGSTGYGFRLRNCDGNTFNFSIGSSATLAGISLENATANNSFNSCTGICTGNGSSDHGIKLSLDNSAYGTNTYSNITSQSILSSSNSGSSQQLLFVGDSITAGGANPPYYGGYGIIVNNTVNLYGNYITAIKGVGGETAATGKIRLGDELAIYDPDYVFIEYGTNDLGLKRANQDIINDIMEMVNTTKAYGAHVYVSLPPARNDYADIQNNTTIFNPLLKTQALANGSHVINAYDAIDATPLNNLYDEYNISNYIDNVHPNNTGNQLISSQIIKELKCTPEFSASSLQGTAPTKITFSDLTLLPTTVHWDFGDNSTSTQQNPAHTYSRAGNYSVNLTVTNDYGNFSINKTDYINVRAQTPPTTTDQIWAILRHYFPFLFLTMEAA